MGIPSPSSHWFFYRTSGNIIARWHTSLHNKYSFRPGPGSSALLQISQELSADSQPYP